MIVNGFFDQGEFEVMKVPNVCEAAWCDKIMLGKKKEESWVLIYAFSTFVVL